MASVGIDDLSPELLGIILESVDTPADLLSLITASKACYSTFLAFPQRILGPVIENAFGSNLQDALCAFYASQEAQKSERPADIHREAVETLLDNHHGRRLKLPTNLADISQLSQIYFRTERFINDYSYRITRVLFGQVNAYLPVWLSPSYADKAGKHGPSLSTTEHTRLARAFLRFDIYCQCFPLHHDPEGRQLFSREDQFQLFLSHLPKWQVEELCSVHQYLSSLVDVVTQALEDEFVHEVLQLATDSSSKAQAAGSTHQNTYERETHSEITRLGQVGLDLFSPIAYHRRDRILSHICSRGLSFVEDLLLVDKTTQRSKIAESYPRFGDFLSESLRVLIRDDDFRTPGFEVRHNRVESSDQYNYGWLLLSAQNYSVVALTPGVSRRPERDVGYVFWDASRLQKARLNQAMTLPGVKRSSAQERLKNIRVPYSPFLEIAGRYRRPLVAA